MAHANPYIPKRSFSDDATSNVAGRSGVNAEAIDAEFNAISESNNKIIKNLKMIQRDDLRLGDEVVEIHTLAREVLMLLGNYRLLGVWRPDTVYQPGDVIGSGEFLYVCAIEHESGASFIDDDKWRCFGSFNSTDAMISAQNAHDFATQAQAALANIDAAISSAIEEERLITNEKFSNLSSDSVSKGDALITVKQPYPGAVPRTQHDKNAEHLSIADFSSVNDLLLAAISSENSVAINNSSGFTITVGASGHFASINDALECAVRLKPLFVKAGQSVEIMLLSGFLMSEQIIVKNHDLSWITIKATDAEVQVDKTKITIPSPNGSKAIFLAVGACARLPTIGCLFNCSIGSGNVNGIMVMAGASAHVLGGSGVKFAANGAVALHGGTINAGSGATDADYWSNGSIFDDSTQCGLFAQDGGVIVAPGVSARRCGTYVSNEYYGGAIAMYGSTMNVQRGKFDHAGMYGVLARDGSKVNARATDVSYAGEMGYFALHGGTINARWFADTGGAGASYCKIGVRAMGAGSSIEAESLKADHCTNEAFYADEGAVINACGSTANNSSTGYTAGTGGVINADQASNANNCSSAGVYAHEGGKVVFSNGQASGCNAGIRASYGGEVIAPNVVASTNRINFDIYKQGKVYADNCNAINATNYGAQIASGGELNATNGAVRGATRSIFATDGARVNVSYSNVRLNSASANSANDIVIYDGAVVTASGTQGGTSTTANAITYNGIIFKV